MSTFAVVFQACAHVLCVVCSLNSLTAEVTKTECCHLAAQAIHLALICKPNLIRTSFTKCGLYPLSVDALMDQLTTFQRTSSLPGSTAATQVSAAPTPPPPAQTPPTASILGGVSITWHADTPVVELNAIIAQFAKGLEHSVVASLVPATAQAVGRIVESSYIKPRHSLLCTRCRRKLERQKTKRDDGFVLSDGNWLNSDKALARLDERKKKKAEEAVAKEAKKQEREDKKAAKAAEVVRKEKAKEDWRLQQEPFEQDQAEKKRKREEAQAAEAVNRHKVEVAATADVQTGDDSYKRYYKPRERERGMLCFLICVPNAIVIVALSQELGRERSSL